MAVVSVAGEGDDDGGGNELGDACKTAADCKFIDAVCTKKGGECKCPIGYSLDKTPPMSCKKLYCTKDSDCTSMPEVKYHLCITANHSCVCNQEDGWYL